MFKAFLILGIFQIGLQLEAHLQAPATVSIRELKLIKGDWQGTLTYLDYTSGKPFSMPANLRVTQAGKTYSFLCAHEYPNETSANTIDTLVLSPDRQRINGKTIISKRKSTKGQLELITEHSGRDGNENKSATIRYIYTIAKNSYSIKKRNPVYGFYRMDQKT